MPAAEPLSLDALLARLRVGEDAAAAEIFRRYAHSLVTLARRRLEGPLQPKVDADDVVQSAFKSFFARHADGQINVTSWDGLWTLLVVITLRKCGRQVRHYRCACRDVRRETIPAITDSDAEASWVALSREPTPDEAALLEETMEQVQEGLDARDRQALALSLDGRSAAEISRELGMIERRVYRLLERVRVRLERLRDAAEV
jgi:RNA polymerase sigma-70 factor (ECF subfamily)